ncbi:MAG: hypothetical protein NTY74_07545 [Ignavibacteriae bacterium]|nr:hypothetical protein [Ignavibacteriota bacterium]
MSKIVFILVLLGMYINLYPQTYDVNYTAEYVLKDARGNEISRLKHYRNGNKLKFLKVDNSGKSNETTTEIFVIKDDAKIITVITNSAGKTGTKAALDIMYVGMQTGIYILDLGNIDYIFNNTSRAGTGNVLGMECVKYTVASNGEASSDYYMYQNNLMLKRSVGSSTEGNTIEALSYDTNIVPESIFTIPADVQYIN